MVLNDDDLIWLKDPANDGQSVKAGSIFMKALLARLDAAEKVCEASAKVVRPKERIGNAPLEKGIFDALEAWLKASGKDTTADGRGKDS